MAAENHKLITLTHFINPQLFWYHKIDVPNESYHQIVALEQQLADFYKNHGSAANSIRPPVSAVVAVNFLGWNKLIRARVDEKANFSRNMQHSGEYIMWALDHGFPFQTTPEHIFRLPEKLARPVDHVRCGGLAGVLPGEKEFDFMESRAVMTAKEQWCQRACDTLDKLLSDADSIEFVEEFESNGQTWGELIVMNQTGERFRVSEYLKAMNLAVDAGSDFRKVCTTLKATKIPPWLSNSGNLKYGTNRVSPYSVTRHDNTNSRNISLNDDRDDFAKRKVEDWCARNHLVVGAADDAADTEISKSTTEGYIDDISFEDSVSVMKYNQQKCDDIKVDAEDQRMGLAGVLTRAKMGKYAHGQVPPKPHGMAFDMSSHSSQDYNQGDKHAPSVSSVSTQSQVSIRKQKLLAIRKQMASQNAQSEKSATDSTSETENCGSNAVPYKHLAESSVDTTTPLDSQLAKIMQKNTLNESSSSSTTISNVSSLPSTRVQRHLEKRQKELLSTKIKPSALSSNNVPSHTTSKRMESLKKAKQEYGSTTKQSEQREPESVVSTGSTTHAEYLMKLRKKYTEQNTKEVVDHKKDAAMKKTSTEMKRESNFQQLPREVKRESNFQQLPEVSTANKKQLQQNPESTYEGLKMVPAGFDLANLNHYNDEKNHWHRKKTTRYDRVPHDDIDLLESAGDLLNFSKSSLESSGSDNKATNTKVRNQNFRHTRSHTDKYKEANILDTSVPDLVDEPICFKSVLGGDQKPTDLSAAAPATDALAVVETSTVSKENLYPEQCSSTPILVRNSKRRQLKSPAVQMSKIDEILRNANFEKEMGNTHILDLSSVNTSGSKTDSDNNAELYSADDGTGTSSTEENTVKVRSSNTRALVGKCIHLREKTQQQQTESRAVNTIPETIPEKLTHHQAHLKSVEERLTLELKNIEVPSSYKIQLPPMAELREVDGEHKLKTKFIEHLVLAHSKVPLSPLTKTADAFFLKEIHDEMQNMRITKLYRLQAYAWPHLLRGNSLFIVNPIKSGKTWSYLPAICSLVCYRIQSGTLPKTYGPVAIVLVPSANQVEVVRSCCRRLLVGAKTPVTIVPSFGVRDTNDVKIQLFNSCGILVATPASLLRLLRDNENESLIDATRLQHLVVDNMDLMLSRSQENLEVVLKSLFRLCKKSGKVKPPTMDLQLVVTSREWDSMMMEMIRRSNQPLLLIGDFLEAAVYGKVNICIKFCSSEQKISKILGFIERYSLEQERLLILCNSDDDVQELVKRLTALAYICIGYHRDSNADVLAIVDEWKKKKVISSRILVCADSVFPELQIQNVQNLIHYSMPTSWTKFTARFAAMEQTYENYVSKDFEASGATNVPAAHCMILLDEENSMQLPRLMDFMKKHDQLKNIHSDILAVSKRVLVAREEARILTGTRMCPYVLEFGECDEVRCDFRHNLTRFDMISKSDRIPTTGDMRILVLKVFSPTHYAARLLEHKSPNSNKWRKLRRSNDVCAFGMELNLHYMNRDNWVLHWPLHINDLCIYKMSDTFQRARILELPEIRHKDVIKAFKVTVRLVDLGSVISCVQSDELFVCDEKFKQFPEQAVEIRLVGVVPFDDERSWDARATKFVQKWIMTEVTKKKCVHISINFALANTVWVNNVIVMEQLPTIGQYVYRVNLKRWLLEKELGTLSDENSRPAIRDVAEEFGLLNELSSSSSESDVDFESCRGNDTSNLIKFSSNEDDTFDNSDTKLEPEKKELKVQLVEVENQKKFEHEGDHDVDTENWDNELLNGSRQDEIYVPLPATKMPNEVLVAKSNASRVEEWCKLPLNQLVKVEIGDENENGNWSDIYLQCIDNETMCLFDELLEAINEHVARLKQLPTEPFADCWFEPMQNCIVKYDDRYLRAKLYGVFGRETTSNCIYRFFLCDYACFVTVKAELLYDDFLYPTTPEIVALTPYQAVHCNLAGIEWDQFAKHFKLTKNYLFAYAVNERTKASMVMSNFEIHSFDILLYECETESDFSSAVMLNTSLINAGVAAHNADTKHYLELGLTVFEKQPICATDAENSVCNFQELIECIQRSLELEADNQIMEGKDEEKIQKVLTQTKAICAAAVEREKVKQNGVKIMEGKDEEKIQKVLTQTKAICAAAVEREKVKQNFKETMNSGNTHSSSKIESPLKTRPRAPPPSDSEEDLLLSTSEISDNGQSLSSLSSTDSAANTPPPPPLKALHKRPQTTWYETDCLIYLAIHAPDIADYYLEVTRNTVYFATEIGGEEYVLVLNLLGSIEPQYISHEIRGLNVVVRLVKSIFIKWPRLLQQTTKFPWLLYNFNAMNTDEIEQLLPQQCFDMALQRNEFLNTSKDDSSDDSDDGERNLYQTFTPIVNSEDIHDPIVEFF